MKNSENFNKMCARNFCYTGENDCSEDGTILSLIQIVESDRFYAALAQRIYSLTFIHQIPSKEDGHLLGKEVVKAIKTRDISCGFIVEQDNSGTYKIIFKSTAKGNN
jgi:hypothetical protein